MRQDARGALILHLLAIVVGFAIVSLASRDIGLAFKRWRLPLITGFLFTGMLTGPYGLALITTEGVGQLSFVDQVSLAVIAIAAGHELYLREIRKLLRSIAWITVALCMSTFTLGAVAIVMLADFVPFLAPMPLAGRVAVALLGGTILAARSPSSAIAIINDVRARGPFTSTTLGVTVVMDIVVIVLFAVSVAIADGLLTTGGFHVGAIALLVGEIAMSIALGTALGGLIHQWLAVPWEPVRGAGLLLLGLSVFAGSSSLKAATDVHLEPLLLCMVAGFVVTNYTGSRQALGRSLHVLSPPIYVVFFTLTGASLALDVIFSTWKIALALVVVRLFGLIIGSLAGGRIAGTPPLHTRLGWMSYVTQAGVALGLAKGVAAAYPEWGPGFASMIIAVIVANQIIGPPFYKWALISAGEAHERGEGEAAFDGVRSVLILGVEGQSLSVAQVLERHGWKVRLADPESDETRQVGDSDVWVHPLPRLDVATLHGLEAHRADAILCMLGDDDNYRACELAYEQWGTRVLVARLHQHKHADRFRALGVHVVDPAAAMVSLFERTVRAPATTAILLGDAADLDMVDVEFGNDTLEGLEVHELRLPLDVAVLYIHRGGQMLTSTGHTALQKGDLVTLSGPVQAIEQASRKLEG